jgi:hypothetical protein
VVPYPAKNYRSFDYPLKSLFVADCYTDAEEKDDPGPIFKARSDGNRGDRAAKAIDPAIYP